MNKKELVEITSFGQTWKLKYGIHVKANLMKFNEIKKKKEMASL